MDNLIKNENAPREEKKSGKNPLAAFLYSIFVHNFGLKVLAAVLSAAVFLLTVGLN